jgi:membrane-associated protein
VIVASVAGAYVGYDLNYWTGRFFSLAVCRRFCPRILREKNMGKARALLERFGPASVVISRFIPAVNLPPFFAGLDSMDYGRYVVANLAGAVLWCGITVVLGYFIGRLDIIQAYVNLLVDLVIVATIAAIGYAAARLLWERREGEGNPA